MKKLIYKIFLGANILVGLGLLMSYLAVIINPEVFALPALFGLAYPYLLLINVVFILGWAVLLKYEALISVVIIAAGINHFSNYLKLTRPSGDKTGTFSALSYNVRLFNYFEGRRTNNSERRIIDFLKVRQPDIICLQEIYINGNPASREADFLTALNGKYQSHMKFIAAGKNRYYGIATISKFPIVARGDLVHQGSSSLSIWTDVIVNNDTVRIFNNHLQSFKLQRVERSFLNELTDASDNNETFKEIRTISSSLKKGFVGRALQAQNVKAAVNKSPHPVIVAGDFNDTPVSYSYRKIRKGLNDSFLTSGYGAGFTYRGNYPPNRIDYILYGNTLNCRQFDIIKVRYSDHYPIIAYFKSRN